MALSVVNSVHNIAASTNTVTTAGISITAGNLIVVATSNFDADSLNDNVSVVDSASNTYTAIGSTPVTGSRHITLWYAKNVTGGASVTFTYNTTVSQLDFPRIYVVQVAGADTVAPLDQFAFTQINTAGTTLTSAGLTTTVANEILFAFSADSASSLTTAFTDGGGANNTGAWTVDQSTSDTSTLEGALAHAIVAATGTYAVTVTTSGSSGTRFLGFVTFKAASASSAPKFRRTHHLASAVGRRGTW